MADTNDLPESYYALHSDELKLLQFLIYHLKTKQEKKSSKTKGFKITKRIEKVGFD